MKNRYIFLLILALPLVMLIAGGELDMLNNSQFSVLLLAYALLYHPFVSAKRLTALKVLKKGEFYSLFLKPAYPFRYFEALYLKK